MDQKPVMRNLKINIAPNHQMRAKFDVVVTRQPVNSDFEIIDIKPVDLVVYDYQYRVDGLTSIAITAKGQERNTKNSFNLTLSIDVLRRRINVRGNCGQKIIQETLNSFSEIVCIAKAFI